MAPDLCLPPRAPVLGIHEDTSRDKAAFAVYSLIGDKVSLQDVASELEREWLEKGMEDHLVQPVAPAAKLETLRDVLEAHIALDKGRHERIDGSAGGNIEWWPEAFIVVVREDWRTKPGGLLFVFADDENNWEMHKFYFKVEDAYYMLSSLSFIDEYLARCKELYAQEPQT